MDVEQFRSEIVAPVLLDLSKYSVDAERLIVGTCLQESRLRFVRQLGNGPARGVAQMEPFTHDDIWTNYLASRPDLASVVRSYCIGKVNVPKSNQLEGNLYYAVAMCRIRYMRVAEALPTTALGMASYWKRYYNTSGGKGSIEEALPHFERACNDA